MQKKVKVSTLTGPALDWVVAKCVERDDPEAVRWDSDGDPLGPIYDANCGGYPVYEPSDDWAQGGPIIQREGITLRDGWDAELPEFGILVHGPTALVAAMRCFVISRLGEEVEVPQEVLA